MGFFKKIKKGVKKLASPIQKTAAKTFVKAADYVGGSIPGIPSSAKALMTATSFSSKIIGPAKTAQVLEKNAAYAIPVFGGELALPIQSLGSAFGGKKLKKQMKNLFIAEGVGTVAAFTAGTALGAFPAGSLPGAIGGETLALAGAGAGSVAAGVTGNISSSIAQKISGGPSTPGDISKNPATPPGGDLEKVPTSSMQEYLPWILIGGGILVLLLFTEN